MLVACTSAIPSQIPSTSALTDWQITSCHVVPPPLTDRQGSVQGRCRKERGRDLYGGLATSMDLAASGVFAPAMDTCCHIWTRRTYTNRRIKSSLASYPIRTGAHNTMKSIHSNPVSRAKPWSTACPRAESTWAKAKRQLAKVIREPTIRSRERRSRTLLKGPKRKHLASRIRSRLSEVETFARGLRRTSRKSSQHQGSKESDCELIILYPVRSLRWGQYDHASLEPRSHPYRHTPPSLRRE